MRSDLSREGPVCVHMAALSTLMTVSDRRQVMGVGTHLVTSNAPIPGVTRNSDDSNRRVSHATRGARSTARQFDLFAPASGADTEKALPEWRTLPDQTRHTLIGLLTRLILDHARGDHHPQSEEAAP